MALADDTSPGVHGPRHGRDGLVLVDMDKVAAAMRGDGAVAWGEHHPHLFSGTEWFFRAAYRSKLTNEWIPALDGVRTSSPSVRRSRHRLRARCLGRGDGDGLPGHPGARVSTSR